MGFQFALSDGLHPHLRLNFFLGGKAVLMLMAVEPSHDHDPAEEATCEDDPSRHNSPGFCRQCQRASDLRCAHCGSTDCETDHPEALSHRGLAEKYRRLLLHISSQKQLDKGYYIECVLIATGDHAAEGISMTAFAKRWRVTRAAVSKHCVAICAFLGIEPSAAMRSEQARESYRRSNVRPLKII